MINNFNTAYNRSISAYNRSISALSIINNIKKSNIEKESSTDFSSVKSLFMQVQAMAELDKFDPVGKKLNIII